MPKFNYVTFEEIPDNILEFYLCSASRSNTNQNIKIHFKQEWVQEINEFLNDLDVWYESQNMKIEDFYG